MEGPKAPRDPDKMRPYFYILKDKEIFGSKQEDGTGIQFVYESDGRLINSAQIAGNITDQEELALLENVEGFRKLVHSIGISVELDDPRESVEFVFQMYGKKDLYGGGTNLKTKLPGDGMERKIDLSDYTWTEDDDIPGQIKFIFQTPELLGKASVRLYLNDGYDAPKETAEEKIDIRSEEYREMIQRSLMNFGNTCRIQRVIEKARDGKEVTLAYIGGSITQGAGAIPIHTKCYAYQSCQLFQKRFAAQDNVRLIKAGVGGTPSELGMIRFDRDVLRGEEQPDLVVIEFAVNDEGDETKGDCYESLVRKVLNLPWKPAVVLLFSVFANDWNLQDRLSVVGKCYDLPMVSIMDAVTPQFKQKQGEGRVLSKNQFFYDIFHPSNIGHTIMADCLMHFFKEAVMHPEEKEDKTVELLEQKAAIGKTFEEVKLLDRKNYNEIAKVSCGCFEETDTELQCVEMDEDLTGTPEFPYNWMYCGKKEVVIPYFEMQICCKALVLIFKDAGDLSVGTADAYVDGKKVLTADPHVNGWVHCNPVILFTENLAKEHTIRIQMTAGEEDKNFTILRFGYVS